MTDQPDNTVFENPVKRGQTDDALRTSEARYRALFENSMDAVLEEDPSGPILAANPAACRMFGMTEAEICQAGRAGLTDRNDPREQELVDRRNRFGFGTAVLTLVRKDGTRFEGEVASVIYETGSGPRTSMIIRDVTGRLQAEEGMRQSRQELRNLAAHLQVISENERKNIAREIHDEVGQAMTALKMDLAALADSVGDDLEVLNKIRFMTNLVGGTLKVVKRLQSELRPNMIDDLGLAEALRWQLDQFGERTKINRSMNISADLTGLGAPQSIAVFRVFQEALTNVARHTAATSVQVDVRQEAGNLVLRIQDDGKGIEPEQIRSAKSFGLLSMRERAVAQGGVLEIRRGPAGGTIVVMTIPLTPAGGA